MSKKEKLPKSPLRIFLDKIVFSLYVVSLVAAVCFSTFVWFQKYYFVSYWVNGQSMWPTLNKEAKDAKGEYFNDDPRNKSMNGATDVDFVIGDNHQNIIDKLVRFDIIICKYSESDSFDKIKRVIALPGETFYIDSTGANNEGNGVLHVLNNETNEFEVVEQPIEDRYVMVGDYPATYSSPYTLADNEYFVMGDNRAHSSDSRLNGPVKKDNIEAKAIALVARCKIVIKGSSGSYQPVDINYMWPRFF